MKLIRNLFYSLPISLRYFVRRLVYLPQDLFRKDKTIPPKGLIYTGGGDFKKIGDFWISYFKKNANLKEDNDFLDIGSGIGRVAVPLSKFLKGNYEGFDLMNVGINWCKKNITSKHNNFSFKKVNLYNDLYQGKYGSAADFIFPYPDNYFDISCATSVFTHMIDVEVENYLEQTYRVLKDNGIMVATFFILDEESVELMKGRTLDFKNKKDNFYYISKKSISANVAFQRDYLTRIINQKGFKIIKDNKGSWCGRKTSHRYKFQDILVLEKQK